jgi:hypothetical protein
MRANLIIVSVHMGEHKKMATREQILSEIRRTAKENGGNPLGKRRFTKKTEIKEGDWERIWTKWNDAVIEAGLTPNTRWKKIAEGFLEEHMVAFIRRRERVAKYDYPTVREMRLEFINNPDFPYSAIVKRGENFIRDLVRYCKGKPDYNDILEKCQHRIDKLDKEEDDDLSSKSCSSVGQVYLYKRGKHYKIGHSNDSVRRGKEIRLETAEDLKFIHSIMTDDPRGVEAYWHKRFKDKRYKKTEFFSLDSQDIRAFKRWRKIY